MKEWRDEKKRFSGGNTPLSCKNCQSTKITDETGEYTCSECGCVLDVQKFAGQTLQGASLLSQEERRGKAGRTTIGRKWERTCSPRSVKWTRLNELNAREGDEKILVKRARAEITRLCHALQVSTTCTPHVLAAFQQVREGVPKRTKYRSIVKLVPIVLYATLKFHHVSVNKNELLSVSLLSRKEFNTFLLHLTRFLPQHVARDRKAYIAQKLLELAEHFGLGMSFFQQSKRIMDGLWGLIKGTTDEVIAGVVTSLNASCTRGCRLRTYHVCDKLGISPSVIQEQVKKRIIIPLHVQGFTSFVKSSWVLRDLLITLGLIQEQDSLMISSHPSRKKPRMTKGGGTT